MKGLLFLTAGTVEKVTGTRDLRQLGGLRKILPVTSLTSLAGSLAISGLPPFNGFWSKLFLIVACLQAGQIGLAIIAVVGALLTMGAFLRVQKEAFFGPERINLAGKKEAPLAMTIPLGILATFCLIIGLTFPYCLKLFIAPAVMVLLR
jgi:multicomponent Na+:H+ antiporter subunit D